MLENGHSNLQTNLWVHITSDIFKISNSKITGSHQPPPPYLPTLKAYPTPGVGGRFGIFSLKWRERMNLKVPRTIFPLALRFWATGRKPLGGWYNPLGLMRLRIGSQWRRRNNGALDVSRPTKNINLAALFCRRWRRVRSKSLARSGKALPYSILENTRACTANLEVSL